MRLLALGLAIAVIRGNHLIREFGSDRELTLSRCGSGRNSGLPVFRQRVSGAARESNVPSGRPARSPQLRGTQDAGPAVP